jgi:hypothetical protein
MWHTTVRIVSSRFPMEARYFISISPFDPAYHRFGSLQFTRGWFEETGQIDSLGIDNLSVAVGKWKNSSYGLRRKVLLTCNPNKGYAYNNFYLPAKKGTLPEQEIGRYFLTPFLFVVRLIINLT